MLISNTKCSSPSLNAGLPRYGHPAHRKASPSPQLPQLLFGACRIASADNRPASYASSRSFRPHVQSSQAVRPPQSSLVAAGMVVGGRGGAAKRRSSSVIVKLLETMVGASIASSSKAPRSSWIAAGAVGVADVAGVGLLKGTEVERARMDVAERVLAVGARA